MFRNHALLEVTDEPGRWILRRPLIWDILPTGDGQLGIVVPEGFETDLASVPRFLRDRKAFDVNGLSREPAILHDYLYATGRGCKEFADLTFYQALISVGVSRWNAWAFYQAVNWFGGSAYREHARRRAVPAVSDA